MCAQYGPGGWLYHDDVFLDMKVAWADGGELHTQQSLVRDALSAWETHSHAALVEGEVRILCVDDVEGEAVVDTLLNDDEYEPLMNGLEEEDSHP